MTSLDRLREIEQAAFAGPWESAHGDDSGWAFVETYDGLTMVADLIDGSFAERRANAEFIATARNTFAVLLDVAEAADAFFPQGSLAATRDGRALTAALDRLREVTP